MPGVCIYVCGLPRPQEIRDVGICVCMERREGGRERKKCILSFTNSLVLLYVYSYQLHSFV